MTANAKPKFAMYWAASCGGCEIAVLNIHEKILDVDANFDVVFWPVAMDAKYKDVEAMEDGSILLTLFNGGIRNDFGLPVHKGKWVGSDMRGTIGGGGIDISLETVNGGIRLHAD